jgi:hypothetical protein
VSEYFQRVGVDIEATAQELARHADARQAEVTKRLHDAKGQVAKAAAACERLDRDYTEGDVDGRTLQRLMPKLEDEHAGAQAAHEMLEQQAATITQKPRWVTDAAAVLSELRAEIAGEVTGAVGLDGIRARLGTTFERFEIATMPGGSHGGYGERIECDDPEPLRAGDWLLLPVPREEWMGDLDGYWQSVLRPVAPLPTTSSSRALSPAEMHAPSSALFPPLVVRC